MRNRAFLGPLYYYFWSIPLFFSDDPVGAYVFAGLLGVLATGLAFELGRRLGGGRAGIASALVFATMPLAVVDGRIAWAPAAVPALVGLVLILVVSLLEEPRRGLALATAAVAAFTVQLHLAAAPILLVAGLAILACVGRLGLAGVLAAATAGVVVLLPTLWAATLPTPGGAVAGGGGDPTSHRLLDMLVVGRRAFEGVSPEPETWPAWVEALLVGETAWTSLVVVAAALVVARLPGAPRPAATASVLGMLAACGLSVLLLPWEAWFYYLDASLLPAAVIVGLAVSTVFGRAGVWALVVVAAARAALVLWWIQAAHGGGWVGANLDLLRLGGERPVDATARARVPTLAARDAAATVLTRRLGLPLAELWSRSHGPGFSDLDTDNGYFFERAARRSASERAATRGSELIVTYRGQIPAEWRSGQPAPVISGPFEILQYEALLDRGAARLAGCAGESPPVRPAKTPLAYGDGALERSEWPCDEPTVEIPLAAGGGDRIRVFVRLDGPGEIVDLSVAPPARARGIADAPAGLGRGIVVEGGATRVRVALRLHGPASLDVFELREQGGAQGATGSQIE